MLKKYLKPIPISSQISIAILILRAGFALLMIPHGYDKIQSFLAGNHDFPDPLHVTPLVSQGLTVFAELICSVLLLVGLLTRPSALILAGCMLIIVFVIQLNDPLQDREHALLYLIGYAVLLITGAGRYSLDAKFFR